jgi:3-hydroxyacyl-CoA dehydrogenase
VLTSSRIVTAEDRSGVRVLTLDNPPVNAFSNAQSSELVAELEAIAADPSVRAVVITARNGFFSGGADINEFQRPPGPGSKNVRDVIAAIEKSDLTFVAAIDGPALGGGCEVILACDYRIATPRSRIGLPEILLGLLPGGGGTQRLPRLLAARNPMNGGLAGIQIALDMMLKGSFKDAKQAKAIGILDEVVEGDVVDRAVALALERAGTKFRISGLSIKIPPPMVAMAHGMVPPEAQGGFAAHKLIDAVVAAADYDFAHGLAEERRLFLELLAGTQSQAAVHLFFAERESAKIPGLDENAKAKEIASAAVVGAGTMGTGIAMVFANAGLPVKVIEVNPEQIARGTKHVADTYAAQVKKGRLTPEKAQARVDSITFVDDYAQLAGVDVAIEAVFESMAIKKQVFEALDKVIKPGALLASNTSTLNIDEIANVTKRPEDVVGLHFFAPANVMQLLEVVRGKRSSDSAIATAMALAKKLKKKGVLSGNTFGFIGNSMVMAYAREANFLAEEGATPWQIDEAIKEFGFPMGPFAMADLSGIDVGYKISLEAPPLPYRASELGTRMYEAGRLGQKTGKGFFLYPDGARKPTHDPEVDAIVAAESARLGITRRAITSQEIVERCMYALINQGATLLGDGIALRPGDIDIVYIFGYGFPWYRGGPMWWADTVGVKKIFDQVSAWRAELGPQWEPAPLLAEVAARDGSFAPRPVATPAG